MKTFICCKKSKTIKYPSQILRTHPVRCDAQGVNLIYALKDGAAHPERTGADWTRERDRLKEQLLPFIKESIKKQLKEEQDYYRSRPSLAMKRMENVVIVPMIASRVYERMEERLRHESLRKGR